MKIKSIFIAALLATFGVASFAAPVHRGPHHHHHHHRHHHVHHAMHR